MRRLSRRFSCAFRLERGQARADGERAPAQLLDAVAGAADTGLDGAHATLLCFSRWGCCRTLRVVCGGADDPGRGQPTRSRATAGSGWPARSVPGPISLELDDPAGRLDLGDQLVQVDAPGGSHRLGEPAPGDGHLEERARASVIRHSRRAGWPARRRRGRRPGGACTWWGERARVAPRVRTARRSPRATISNGTSTPSRRARCWSTPRAAWAKSTAEHRAPGGAYQSASRPVPQPRSAATGAWRGATSRHPVRRGPSAGSARRDLGGAELRPGPDLRAEAAQPPVQAPDSGGRVGVLERGVGDPPARSVDEGQHRLGIGRGRELDAVQGDRRDRKDRGGVQRPAAVAEPGRRCRRRGRRRRCRCGTRGRRRAAAAAFTSPPDIRMQRQPRPRITRSTWNDSKITSAGEVCRER